MTEPLGRPAAAPGARRAFPARLRRLGALAPLLGGLAQPLAAQLKSVPVYPLLAAGRGWAAALDYGSGLNDASGHARHLGARVGAGTARVRLTAAGGAWDAGASTSAQFGGTALLRVLGKGSGGLALHALAGAGYTRAGPADSAATYVTIPLGLAVVRSGLQTSRGAMMPWLASLVEFDGVSFGAVRATQTGVGLSGGLAATLHGRLGAHAAFEWMRMFQRGAIGVTLSGGTRVTAGVGVHLLLSGTR